MAGLRMKRLPHALFGHTVDERRLIWFVNSYFECQHQLQVLLFREKDIGVINTWSAIAWIKINGLVQLTITNHLITESEFLPFKFKCIYLFLVLWSSVKMWLLWGYFTILLLFLIWFLFLRNYLQSFFIYMWTIQYH